MSGTRSATGLVCSHGSHMDEKIPRPKQPKTALPPELRRKLGFQPRKEEEESSYDIYKAGSGVLAPVGSGRDGSFLKMKSSVPMSHRASAHAKMTGAPAAQGGRAYIPRARLITTNNVLGINNVHKEDRDHDMAVVTTSKRHHMPNKENHNNGTNQSQNQNLRQQAQLFKNSIQFQH